MTNAQDQLGRWVEIVFDCLPLRAMQGATIPDDASPKLAAKLDRIRAAREKHGAYNSYYLHNAKCTYYFTNDPKIGMCQFEFEGVVLTDPTDMQARACDLGIELARETCSWLNQAVVAWLTESIDRAVLVEFNRYIQLGDLTKTIERIEALQKEADEAGGFVGMYL